MHAVLLSAVACERGFSKMNVVCARLYERLSPLFICHLCYFISVAGPPVLDCRTSKLDSERSKTGLHSLLLVSSCASLTFCRVKVLSRCQHCLWHFFTAIHHAFLYHITGTMPALVTWWLSNTDALGSVEHKYRLVSWSTFTTVNRWIWMREDLGWTLTVGDVSNQCHRDEPPCVRNFCISSSLRGIVVAYVGERLCRAHRADWRHVWPRCIFMRRRSMRK